MDKSPLKTLTLEDFLESERHKLTGQLTPVTPETFAKWKKDRMDKKAAEEQARTAKENTGRALFESGNWRDEDDSEDDDDDDAWNLEKLRRETEVLRDRREEDRLTSSFIPGQGQGESAEETADDQQEEDGAGEQVNGVAGGPDGEVPAA